MSTDFSEASLLDHMTATWNHRGWQAEQLRQYEDDQNLEMAQDFMSKFCTISLAMIVALASSSLLIVKVEQGMPPATLPSPMTS